MLPACNIFYGGRMLFRWGGLGTGAPFNKVVPGEPKIGDIGTAKRFSSSEIKKPKGS